MLTNLLYALLVTGSLAAIGCGSAASIVAEDAADPAEAGGDGGEAEGAVADVMGDTLADASVDASPCDASSSCGECAPGARDCLGEKPRECDASGHWTALATCSGATPLCRLGVCTAASCASGEGRCNGNELEICNATNTGFTFVTRCPEGLCDATGKECDECKTGETECAANVPRACDATGHWKDLAACSGSTAQCTAGVCVAPTSGWRSISFPTFLAGRRGHTAVWTGSDMIVFGGTSPAGPFGDGGRYNVATDQWTALPKSTLGTRVGHTAVWTGTKMIVWGGRSLTAPSTPSDMGNGAAYDPATNVWTELAPANVNGTPDRADHVAVWTGAQMLVWGGNRDLSTRRADGLIWTPGGTGGAGSWTVMAPSPLGARASVSATWTGSRMIVYGGLGCPTTTNCADGAAYDPTNDSWLLLPAAPVVGRHLHDGVANGAVALFLHGRGATSYLDDGAVYDPIANGWTSIAPPGDTILPRAQRAMGFVWWGAGSLFTFGGEGSDGTATGNGASYDPSSKVWTSMRAGGPNGRFDGTVVWTGTSAILWGGHTKPSSYWADGKMYTP